MLCWDAIVIPVYYPDDRSISRPSPAMAMNTEQTLHRGPETISVLPMHHTIRRMWQTYALHCSLKLHAACILQHIRSMLHAVLFYNTVCACSALIQSNDSLKQNHSLLLLAFRVCSCVVAVGLREKKKVALYFCTESDSCLECLMWKCDVIAQYYCCSMRSF